MHTSSAAKTIDRIVDVFPAAEKEMVRAMLSESLRAVISQTLLKKIGGGRIAAHEIRQRVAAAIEVHKQLCALQQELSFDGRIDGGVKPGG